MAVEIHADAAQLRWIARDLRQIPNALPRVVSRSINRVARQAQSRAVKALAAALGGRQKDIRGKKVRLLRASWRRWRARLFFDGGGLLLSHLDPRQTEAGVTYRAAGGRQLMPRAFIATMPTGHRGVFLREPQAGLRSALVLHGGQSDLVGRLPIFEPRSPSIRDIADRLGLFDQIEDFAGAELARQLDVQTQVVLAQFARRRRR